MAFTYSPKTDEQIEKEENESRLFEPGIYGFEVIQHHQFGEHYQYTKDTESKKGNDMMQLVIRIFDPEGRSTVLRDYLLDVVPRKLKESAYACGLGNDYEAGTLCAEKYIGKSGNLELAVQPGRNKNDGTDEKYPDRNVVNAYVIAANDSHLDDDIPFD